jgi:hypothetical protein
LSASFTCTSFKRGDSIGQIENSVKFRLSLASQCRFHNAPCAGNDKVGLRTVAITQRSVRRCDPGSRNESLQPQGVSAWKVGRRAEVADRFPPSATRLPSA